jgi:hypothetical protein
MNTYRISWTIVAVVSIAIAATTGTRTTAQVIGVVSPASTATVEGNADQTPALLPTRVQFLIPASDFANLPASHRRIVAFNNRADITQTQSLNWHNGDQRVWMSTTSLNTLTTTFDNNHGADRTLVHDGSRPSPLLATGPAGGPRDFAPGTRLDTPFVYDPSKGNLLIEQLVYGTNTSAQATIDTQLTSQARLILGNPNSPTGILLTEVPVFRFEFVPEPSTYVLAGMVLTFHLIGRRKQRGLLGA